MRKTYLLSAVFIALAVRGDACGLELLFAGLAVLVPDGGDIIVERQVSFVVVNNSSTNSR